MSRELNEQQNASVGMTVGMIEVRLVSLLVFWCVPRKRGPPRTRNYAPARVCVCLFVCVLVCLSIRVRFTERTKQSLVRRQHDATQRNTTRGEARRQPVRKRVVVDGPGVSSPRGCYFLEHGAL